MSLTSYHKRRNFRQTPEPKGMRRSETNTKDPIFVIQKHDARTLHYDLRLEIEGVLKSWAVPKGAPKKGEKHLAILTEDHPMEYASFEGEIPKGEYGAGTVKIWDQGTYKNLKPESMKKCFQRGILEFQMEGKRLKGTYILVHFKNKHWLLMKGGRDV